MSRLESELAAEWRDKSDRLLSVERDRHARALREVADEKQQLQEKLQAQQDKVHHVTSGVRVVMRRGQCRLLFVHVHVHVATSMGRARCGQLLYMYTYM